MRLAPKVGDYVTCPTGKIARVIKLEAEGRVLLQYVGEIGTGAYVSLLPKLLLPAEKP